MTIKQITTLHYILGRLNGLLYGIKDETIKNYLTDTCMILANLLDEDKKE